MTDLLKKVAAFVDEAEEDYFNRLTWKTYKKKSIDKLSVELLLESCFARYPDTIDAAECIKMTYPFTWNGFVSSVGFVSDVFGYIVRFPDGSIFPTDTKLIETLYEVQE